MLWRQTSSYDHADIVTAVPRNKVQPQQTQTKETRFILPGGPPTDGYSETEHQEVSSPRSTGLDPSSTGDGYAASSHNSVPPLMTQTKASFERIRPPQNLAPTPNSVPGHTDGYGRSRTTGANGTTERPSDPRAHESLESTGVSFTERPARRGSYSAIQLQTASSDLPPSRTPGGGRSRTPEADPPRHEPIGDGYPRTSDSSTVPGDTVQKATKPSERETEDFFKNYTRSPKEQDIIDELSHLKSSYEPTFTHLDDQYVKYRILSEDEYRQSHRVVKDELTRAWQSRTKQLMSMRQQYDRDLGMIRDTLGKQRPSTFGDHSQSLPAGSRPSRYTASSPAPTSSSARSSDPHRSSGLYNTSSDAYPPTGLRSPYSIPAPSAPFASPTPSPELQRRTLRPPSTPPSETRRGSQASSLSPQMINRSERQLSSSPELTKRQLSSTPSETRRPSHAPSLSPESTRLPSHAPPSSQNTWRRSSYASNATPVTAQAGRTSQRQPSPPPGTQQYQRPYRG